MAETYRTPQDIARELRISVDVARREFRLVEGVLMVRSGKRKLLRIPESVYQAWLKQREVGAIG